MSKVKTDNEIVEVEDINVTVESKEGLGTKVKNGASKIIKSKPVKILGGVALVALCAVGATVLNKKKDFADDDVIDVDDIFDDVEAADIEVTEI